MSSTAEAESITEPSLQQFLQGRCSSDLANVLCSIADACKDIAAALETIDTQRTGTTNRFGDAQLEADLKAQQIIVDRLSRCSDVGSCCSEEEPVENRLPGSGFSVAFDPLDGSSIVDANFAVGSIFGVWRGSDRTLVGRSGRDQTAAAYAVYGTKCLLVLAVPNAQQSTGSTPQHSVHEFILKNNQEFVLHRENLQISRHAKYFAPANLRCASENPAYNTIIQQWISERYTLRYTGGLVPDVHHIITKGGGVFCFPVSATAPAKLRVLYECMPMALIVEAAGGTARSAYSAVLDMLVENLAQKCAVVLGSSAEVDRCIMAFG